MVARKVSSSAATRAVETVERSAESMAALMDEITAETRVESSAGPKAVLMGA